MKALDRGVAVIPVLVGGATMPRPEELPGELAPLTRRNALDISDQHWNSGVRRLIEALERVVSEDDRPVLRLNGAARRTAPRSWSRRRWRRWLSCRRWGSRPLGAGSSCSAPPFASSRTSIRLRPGERRLRRPLRLAGALRRRARRGAGAARRAPRQPARLGMLLGFAVAAAAKHIGALGVATATEIDEDSIVVTGSAVAALGAVVVLLAALRASGDLWRRAARPLLRTGQAGAAAAIAGAGALALVIATFVPFKRGRPAARVPDGLRALRPLGGARADRRSAGRGGGGPAARHRPALPLPAGILIALGLAEGLLALRYIGVPIVQPDEFPRSARAAPSCSGSARGPLAEVLARSWGERAVAWRE